MVSKAMSGVKRPVLPVSERTSNGATKNKTNKQEDGGEKEGGREEG